MKDLKDSENVEVIIIFDLYLKNILKLREIKEEELNELYR